MEYFLVVLLVLAGVALLLTEMFLIPGFGIAGVFGFGCLIGAVVLAWLWIDSHDKNLRKLFVVVHQLWHLNVATVVTSVGVGLDIDIGLNECPIVGQMEFDVFDSKSSAEPLLLVVGFDFQYVVG